MGAPTLSEAVRQGAEIFHALKAGLKAQGLSTGIGDEGGFAPALTSAEAALDAIMAAIEAAGYAPGRDTMLALDCAATEYYRDGSYVMDGTAMTSDEHIAFLAGLLDAYPIFSIEDGCAEDDWDGWAAMTEIWASAANWSATICS